MYSTMTFEDKTLLVSNLHAMRNTLSTEARHTATKRAKKAVKKMTFESKEKEDLFNSLSPECQKLFM